MTNNIINKKAIENTLSNPNKAVVLQAMMMKTGPLADLEFVRLGGTYKEDFWAAYLHPVHNNEALAYDEVNDLWVILDCCGDITHYPSLSEALSEFLSPMGHSMWLELKECGQHREDRYFAA